VEKSSTYFVEWNGDSPDFASAPTVTLLENGTTTNNFQIFGKATASGTVTSPLTGLPVKGSKVTVYAADGSVLAQDTTNIDGYYSIPALPAGNYRIQFKGVSPLTTKYAGNGGQTKATAEAVPFLKGANVYDIQLGLPIP
jgi:hypothetical protein